MLKTYAGLILVVVLMISCRAVKSIPEKYMEYQDKKRSHMIAVFMDGTRDLPHKERWKNTHVRTSHTLADTNNIKSLYIEGVGAGNRMRHAIKAITTGERIMRAYRFLTENYRSANDSICLFGFSRGANQCRILSGFIYTIGIINLNPVKKDADKQRLLRKLYTANTSAIGIAAKRAKMMGVLSAWSRHHPGEQVTADTTGTTKIELMALWDTVEAFSIWDDEETPYPQPQYLNQLYNVKKLFHAASLDDNRALIYTPILATHKNVALHDGQDINSIVEEVWFNGSHKDLGGGVSNEERDQLSGISLRWMLAKLKPYRILKDTLITTCSFGKVNNSRRDAIGKLSSGGDRLRSINKYLDSMNVNWNNHRIKVHQSVIERLENGYVQDFKTIIKDGPDRADWYNSEPFNKCFTRDTVGNKTVWIFDKVNCRCIEVVND